MLYVLIYIDRSHSMSSQMYVALSKITNLPGLFLICSYTQVVFKVNNATANEYDRLRAEQTFAFCQLSERVLPKKIVISLFECLIIKETFLRYLKYFMFGSDWYIGF